MGLVSEVLSSEDRWLVSSRVVMLVFDAAGRQLTLAKLQHLKEREYEHQARIELWYDVHKYAQSILLV